MIYKFADRMNNIGTEKAFEVLAKCKKLESEGKDIIHLQIGEPDFDTPRNIIEAGQKALSDGYTHYTPNLGIYEVRESIARYAQKTKSIITKPEEVVIVPGGKPIMFYTFMALVNPGDEVIYPNPGYPIYESLIRFTGAKPVPMPLIEDNDFRVDIEDLKKKINDKTKLIIINSPANPTGGVFSKEDIENIANLIRDKDIYVLSDEIYERINYGIKPTSIASIEGMKDKTIILDGFSKIYAMTGWRAGYGIMNEEIADRVDKLIANVTSNTAAFTQIAMKEALEGPQEDPMKMVQEFKRRRDLMVSKLNSIDGISCKTPQGAFYAFPNIRELGMSSEEMADYLLYEANVAVLDGKSFGEYGEGHLRLSYATSTENIIEAIDRIKEAVSKL